LSGQRDWPAYLGRKEAIVSGRLTFIMVIMEGNRSLPAGRGIFVVHGHDEAARESVARFIEKLGLRAVVLHEHASGGRTIIEKFEEESSHIGFAVVLLTPDDVGASRDRPGGQGLRPRQNVVFELGYFVGKLGRKRVCMLYKGDVQVPSDCQGVLYVPMDAAGAWRIRLAQEIRHAGIEIDLNQAFR
jgi:predicted nucleotide-binding protein